MCKCIFGNMLGMFSRLLSLAGCLAGGCKEVVLDAELVAIDRDKANELKSFQELSTRARGAIAASEVPKLS